MRKIRFTRRGAMITAAAAALVVSSGSAAALAACSASTATASTTAATTRPPRPAVRCVTFDITGRPAVGMPWDEPVTFCGRGIQPGAWTCPATTSAVGPGTREQCARQ